MKKSYFILTALLFVMLSSCSNESSETDGLTGAWTFFSHSNVQDQFSCEYESRDIVWKFKNHNLDIEGMLIDPIGFQPCYDVDTDFSLNDLDLFLETDLDTQYIQIPEMNFEAKILRMDNELILEIITNSGFLIIPEGRKLLFNRI